MSGLAEGLEVLVTGAASGIGAAAARRLVDHGAVVALVDRDEERLGAVAEAVGGFAIVCDVGDRDALADAVAEAAAGLGGLTTLVNNAGAGMLAPIEDYDDDQWDRLVEVHLTATFVATRAAIGHLRAAAADGRPASIVNNVGGVAARPTRGEGPYSAAKAGVVALTKSCAVEFAPAVRVNAVSPTFADTPLTAPLLADPSVRADLESRIPFGRVGTAAENVTHKVYFGARPSVRPGDQLVVTSGPADVGAVLKVQADADRSAGKGVLFGVMCEEEANLRATFGTEVAPSQSAAATRSAVTSSSNSAPPSRKL